MFEMQGDDPDVYLHTSRKKNIGMYFVIQICYFGFESNLKHFAKYASVIIFLDR